MIQQADEKTHRDDGEDEFGQGRGWLRVVHGHGRLRVSIERDGAPTDDTTSAAVERAAEAAGAWLLGARALKLDPYLRALRESLDPGRIMNPGTLT